MSYRTPYGAATLAANGALKINAVNFITGNSLAITLPINPSIGDIVGIIPVSLTTGPTITTTDSTLIEAGSVGLVVDDVNWRFNMRYTGTTYGWKVIN